MTDTKPLITFVVTTFNLPTAYLRECLASIVSLELEDSEREILLVDDGSEISPFEELEDFHSQITYLRKANGGLSSARNMGIEHARGQYIQFVDGDDALIAEAYNRVIGEIRKQTFDIVLFRLSTSPQPRRGVTERLGLFLVTYGDVYLRKQNLRSAACGYAFRREVLGELRFALGVVHEDVEFTSLIFLKSNLMAHTPLQAYYYRQREGSIMNNVGDSFLEKRFRDYMTAVISLQRRSQKGRDGHLLSRRIDQLVMDHIYNIVSLTHSPQRLQAEIDLMRRGDLFPLPLRHHTTKYLLFALATRFSVGRKLLFKIF